MLSQINTLTASFYTNALETSNINKKQNIQSITEKTAFQIIDILDISQQAFDLNSDDYFNNFRDPYSFLAAAQEHFGGDIEDILLNDAQRYQVDLLHRELDQIFGVPKENLTGIERLQEKQINAEIDKILEKTQPKALTNAQERQFDATQKEIYKLFADGELTADEEVKLKAFNARIEKLFEGVEGQELTASDQEKLDKLHGQLDNLYGLKQPDKAQIARAEEIFNKLDSIYDNAVNNFSQSLYDFDGLSDAQQNDVFGIFDDIESLFIDAIESSLSDEEQAEVDAIYQLIDNLLLSEPEKKRLNIIERQIDKIFEDDVVTADEEKILNRLDKQIDDIFNNSTKKLNASENELLSALETRLNNIYDRQSAKLGLDFNHISQLSDQLDQIFS